MAQSGHGVKAPRSLRSPGLSATARLGERSRLRSQSLAARCPGAGAEDENSEASPTVDVIEVFGEADALYEARVLGDARHVAQLAETPQTITVLTPTELLDSGRSDLGVLFAAQAGITLGAGENSNAFGDHYVIRGHEARSDVLVDGVRDPGMTTRESLRRTDRDREGFELGLRRPGSTAAPSTALRNRRARIRLHDPNTGMGTTQSPHDIRRESTPH